MSNSTAKGNAHELEVKKHLEAHGWVVFRVHKKAIFINGRMVLVGADAFGCDLIAKKQGEKTLWIQVGADGALSKKKDQLLQFPWNLENETPEIWLRLNKQKVYRVYALVNIGGLIDFIECAPCKITRGKVDLEG